MRLTVTRRDVVGTGLNELAHGDSLHPTSANPRLVLWGTYDTTKPRVQILLAGLHAAGFQVVEIHRPIWNGVRDKGTLASIDLVLVGIKWCAALPSLLVRYLRAPRHQLVLVPYLGLLDVIVLWPFARLRGARIAWDQFLSGYDTVVNDRGRLGPWNPIALAIYALEWLASRLADLPFLDTAVHARRFEKLMRLPHGSVSAIPLGTFPDRFPQRATDASRHEGEFTAIFYGQYIPLHGLDTVVRAAAALQRAGVPVRWLLVGDGQEKPRITSLIASLGVTSVAQLGWIPAQELPALVHSADVGLGIFGTSQKALSVVPNKVYEMAAMQIPIVTGDTPAIRATYSEHPLLHLVPPGDPEALATCLAELAAHRPLPSTPPLPVHGPLEVGKAFRRLAERLA